jgi:hypothetical protein
MGKSHPIVCACLALLLAGACACGEDKPNPSGPAAGGPGVGVPEGYSVAAATDAGKKLVVHKADATSVSAALKATLADLAKSLDARPAVRCAFTDAKSPGSGGASFTARLGGQAIKGLILCSTDEKGADIAVAYCRADAPASEWTKLRGTTASATPGHAQATPGTPGSVLANVVAGIIKPAEVQMEAYSFPDGTGSIGLPEGWKTNAQTSIHGVSIQGPADQSVTIGHGLEVCTPDSMVVQTQLRMAAQAQQMRMPPPPPLKIFIAPYSGPLDALKNIVPQLNQMSRRAGGPGITLDQVLESQTAKANFLSGQAALVYYAVTRTTAGNAQHRRALARMETYPIGGPRSGTWGIYWTELAAPDATFDQDLPVMLAITHSQKENAGAIQAATNREIAASNQRTAAALQANAERQKAFDGYLQSVQHNQLIMNRSTDNFDEIIRGERTVQDTQTGERHSVDLGHVDAIVDELNKSDPGRYVQVPLRDEMDPLPNHSNP